MNRKDEKLRRVKTLKSLVKAYAKASKPQLDIESAGITLGGIRHIKAETLGMQRADVPIPWFSRDSKDPAAAVYDAGFWMAIREAKGGPEEEWLEEVWQRFTSNLICFRRGERTVLDGMMLDKNRRSGGKADKTARAIMELVRRYAKTIIPAAKIFKMFPQEHQPAYVTLPDGEYEVYRDGDVIVQVSPTGNLRTVNARTLAENYVAKARKENRVSRRK
jgi:hypothetical protein